jgi:signal transduction histidine kinase
MFKILVVEDDKDLNKTVCSVLKMNGYEAYGCLNATDGYDALYDNIFDLIISDIMMPDIDGFEFAKNVRDINENIPIMFMTAKDDIASKQRGFRIGIDDYMVKPIDFDELILRIGALMRRAKIVSSKRLQVGDFVMDAASRLVKGDFSARVEPIKSVFVDDNLKEISRCFNKMAEELSGVETIRTDFISNVSHEMKTPLSVMQNYATLLQSPELSDDKRMEYAKGIALGSKKLADMMTNILKLNRLENQKIYPKTSRYNLGEQLCECIINYETIWERKNIEIETNIEEDVYVNGDEELLTLVWNNLLSNAFKFTDDGGKVTITLESDEEKAIVRVKDTGCGISGDVGARIFEKFYQADTARATSGNGLGLALVKRVIDILKGEIEVSSVVDEGTTFTVRLTKA